MTLRNKAAFLLLLLTLGLTACGVYRFRETGSVPGESFSVELFPNQAALVNPFLSQQFSDALREKFARETRLSQVQRDGDLQFSGAIINYLVTPAALQGDQGAPQNRLTIQVHVKYINKIEPKRNFEKNYENFADFPASSQLAAVESQLVQQINDKLVQQIFNDAVVSW